MPRKIYTKIVVFLCLFTLNIFNYGFVYKSNNELYLYEGVVEHLAFETLMSFPERALDEKNHLSQEYDSSKITPQEFDMILEQLYQNNFVLVDVESLYSITPEGVSIKKLYLPQNKKPIILSFDNVTYKSNYQNLGNIDKIIVDRNNNLASYTTKKSIQDRIQNDNEFMLILENFITEHPDFSFMNSRGIIFLTGENGILGYNTNSKNSSSRVESKRVLEVVQKLKKLGWKFGCNGYTFKEESTLSDIEFAKDISLWKKEIMDIVGNTPLFAYPYGTKSDSQTKAQVLHDNGFCVLFIIDTVSPSSITSDDSITFSRRFVCGETLRHNEKDFQHLFDCERVYDHAHRNIIFNQLTQ